MGLSMSEAERQAWVSKLAFKVFNADPQSVIDLDRADDAAFELRRLYAERGYGDRVAFREPTPEEYALAGLRRSPVEHYQSPAWGGLVVDGEATGWHYVRSEIDHGCFYFDAGNVRMAFSREEDAQKTLAMLWDAATRGFDPGMAGPLSDMERVLGAGSRLYVAREDVHDVLVEAGERQGDGATVFRRETIGAGTRVAAEGGNLYAVVKRSEFDFGMRRNIRTEIDGKFLQLPTGAGWLAWMRRLDPDRLVRFPAGTPTVIEAGWSPGERTAIAGAGGKSATRIAEPMPDRSPLAELRRKPAGSSGLDDAGVLRFVPLFEKAAGRRAHPAEIHDAVAIGLESVTGPGNEHIPQRVREAMAREKAMERLLGPKAEPRAVSSLAESLRECTAAPHAPAQAVQGRPADRGARSAGRGGG